MQQSRVRTVWKVTAGLGRDRYSTWWDGVGGLELRGEWRLVASWRGRRGVDGWSSFGGAHCGENFHAFLI